MNSLQKQQFPIQEPNQDSYVLAFKKSLEATMNSFEIEMLMKKLQFLSLHYNPFGHEVSSECQQIINDLGLSDHLANPYLATNVLLRLLDKTEEHLNNLKH